MSDRLIVERPSDPVGVATSVAWIAHAGGAITLPGGAPTRASLADAIQFGVDWIEVDVCATADGGLVMHHDLALPSRRVISDLTLAQLRRHDPQVLTLDEAYDVMRGRVSVLLDLKTDLAAAPLARWMRSRSGSGFAVCTDSLPALLCVRAGAPQLPRWLSLPDLGPGSYRGMRGALSGLLRQWSGDGLGRLGQEFRGAVADVARSHPSTAIPRLGSVPYRAHLPAELRRLANDVGASALSLHHWVVTRDVCEAAHAEGLPVAAWTVNRGEAVGRLIECGVDLITTDRVGEMRTHA